MKIQFYKLSGSGNDFILIDNRNGIVKEEGINKFAAMVCRDRLSLGGDGIIFIEKSERCDFKWRLFNTDGSEAEMSGNGGRCAVKFAYLTGIAPEKMSFETLAGIVRGEVNGDLVKIEFPNPKDLKMNLKIEIDGKVRECHFINTGVPHAVYLVDNIEQVDVIDIGRKTRYHQQFSPAGTNVNFIKVIDRGRIRIRTYERGVENETLACGSGSVASALISKILHDVDSPVTMLTQSGINLNVYFNNRNNDNSDIFLEGDARVICDGFLWEDSWR